VQQWATLRGFSVAHVADASSPDDIPWHEQADCTIDRPTVPGDLRVSALRPDLVAEEPRHLAGGVSDQSRGFGQLQLELITQELADLRLDLHGFALRTSKPQEKIAVPHIPKPPITGIVRVLARQTMVDLASCPPADRWTERMLANYVTLRQTPPDWRPRAASRSLE
jgi:hypothetical protein